MGCKIMLFHGGEFQRVPHLVYSEGECSEVDCDPDYLNMSNLMEMVEKMGYPQDKISKLLYAEPGCVMKDALVVIEGDNDIRQLSDLLLQNEYVCVYVEHNQENPTDQMVAIDRGHEDTVHVEGGGGVDDVDDFGEEDCDEFRYWEFSCDSGSDVDDDEALEARNIMTIKLNEATEAEREAVENDDVGEVEGELMEGNYHDSDNADSPYTDSDEGDKQVDETSNIVGGKDKMRRIIDRNRKRKKRIRYCRYNPRVKLLEVGMVFPNKKACKKAVDDYRIRGGYNLRVTKSDKERLQLKCVAEGCEWRFWASKVNKALSFEIKTIDKPHTCIPYSFEVGQRNMSSEWLAEHYADLFRLQPSFKARQLQAKIKLDLNFNATLSMCVRIRRMALTSIIGDYRTQFEQLKDYLFEVHSKNPGSTVRLMTNLNEENKHIFEFLYICPGPLKQGFLEGCRRIVSVDACFLKGPWDGQVFVAVGRDANDQMYPVAWGVGQSERKEIWGWFLEELQRDLNIGDGFKWTFISDQQKGLESIIKESFPRSEHRMCARHVYVNLRKNWGGKTFRNVFWRIAKATNEVPLERYLNEMNELDPDALEFLKKKGLEHFSRKFFGTFAHCDSVDNNVAEIFDAFIIDARYQPIVSMLRTIYKLVMKRTAQKQVWANRLEGPIAPRIRKKLDKRINEARYWEVVRAGGGLYSVSHEREEFVVDLNNKSCTCRSWELSGLPCRHAIAVFREEKLKPVDYVHDCYSVQHLKKTYSHTLKPINGEGMWAKFEGETVFAPYFKPKKKTTSKYFRRPEAGEKPGPSQGRVSKQGTKMHCSNCGKEGHNKRGCDERLSCASQHMGRRQTTGNQPRNHHSQARQPQPPTSPPPPQPLPLPPTESPPHTIQPPLSPETKPPLPSPPPTQLTQPTPPSPPPIQPQPTRPPKLQAIGRKGIVCQKKPRMTTKSTGTKIILPINCKPPSRKEASKQVFGPSTAAVAASVGHGSASSTKVSVKAAPKMKFHTKSAMSWFTCSSSYSTVAYAASPTAASGPVIYNVAVNAGHPPTDKCHTPKPNM